MSFNITLWTMPVMGSPLSTNTLPRIAWAVASLSGLLAACPAVHGAPQGGSGAGVPYQHVSSIDGAPLEGLVFVPPTVNPSTPTALVIYLHGGGGLGIVPQGWATQLQARGWILIAPHGRRWALADPALCPSNPNASGICNWCTSAAYVDNPFDLAVGPGEQDILDSIAWARSTYNINADRIYLTGFSMGGRGTYQIGLRNPHLFAAIAPCAPASDMFEIFVRDPNGPDRCKKYMLHDGKGGLEPGDSGATDAMYFQTSARFLIENAMNLPVHHSHGTQDALAYNLVSQPTQYLHGAHMISNTSFSGCHGTSDLCFGHTPTLSELAARFPGRYTWSSNFTPVAHVLDTAWINGIFGHFDASIRPATTPSILYKTYTDTARRSGWLEVDSAVPWTGQPAASLADAVPASNTISIRTCRARAVTVDLPAAQLSLTPSAPLTMVVGRLDPAGLDPALNQNGAPDQTTIRLRGAAACGPLIATINGQATPPGFVRWSGDAIELGPIGLPVPISSALTVMVAQTSCQSPCPADLTMDRAIDGADVALMLAGWGRQESAGDVDGNGDIDGQDLAIVLATWGPCR